MSTKAVVNKMTKAQLKEVLNQNFKAIKKVSKELADSVSYTAKAFNKDEKSVTKKDLLDLVKDAMTALGEKFVFATDETPVAVENSVKKTGTKSKKTDEKTEEKKAPAKKESAVRNKKADTKSEKEVVLAEQFSEEITIEDNKYEIAHDIDSMEKLMEAFNNEETIVFAMYWSKRHLKQFNYFQGDFEAPTEFPMDLDISECIYVSDEGIVAYATSLYTEACYMFKPEDFEEVDGLRFAGSIEFQIYRLVEEE